MCRIQGSIIKWMRKFVIGWLHKQYGLKKAATNFFQLQKFTTAWLDEKMRCLNW